MPGESESRNELAKFLRSRRERLTPEQVGFPAGSRRRTRGLRREEVAVLAGLSPTWYTYLEQGRKIQPSPEVLDSIARVLRLAEDERRYMHTLAFGHVVQPQPLEAELPADSLLQRVVAVTEDMPYPVYATNMYCDLIAWNRAAAEWYGNWDSLQPRERNLLHWMLTDKTARECLADWEMDARDTAARWRIEVARWPADIRLARQVAEFRCLSTDFDRWWNEHDVLEHRSRVRYFRHPVLGPQALRIVPMQSAHSTSAGVVFHLPVSDAAPLSG